MIIPILFGVFLLSGCAPSMGGSRVAKKHVDAPKGKPFEHELTMKGECSDDYDVRHAAAKMLMDICNGRGSMKFNFPAVFSCDNYSYSIDHNVTITCKDNSDCKDSSIYSESNNDLHGLYPLQSNWDKAIDEIVVSNKFVDECDGGEYTFAARFKEGL